MEPVVANGCSPEPPPAASDGSKHLRHQAGSFIQLYKKKEARLRDLLGEIQELGVQVNKWNTKSRWSVYTGLVCSAVTVVAACAVPFVGGLGFAVTAALTSVCAGGAVFGFKIKQFRTEEESLKQIREFLKITNRLEHDLDQVMKLCESSEKHESQNIPPLRSSLVTLFRAMDAFRNADGVNELTAQSLTVFGQMENMRRHLEELRGGAGMELVIVSEINSEKPNEGSANEKRMTAAESSSLLQQTRG